MQEYTYAIIQGNPVDGFTLIGPFQSHDEAVEYGDSARTDWYVMTMDAPEER